MIFRVRFAVKGDHVHCRVFTAKADSMTFAKCGDLVFRKGAEMRDFVAAFQASFLGDEENVGLVQATSEN